MMRGVAAGLLAVLSLACLLFAPAGVLDHLPLGTPLLPPSALHPFGTDDLGRDLLAAVLQGGRASLTVGQIATSAAFDVGLIVGLVAGLAPPLLEEIVMRATEIVASLSTLLLAILVASLFGGSTLALALDIGLTGWPVIARLVRIETITVCAQPSLRAAVALGVSPAAIVRRHVLPVLVSTLAASSGIVFGGAILAEAALAFVGLGDPAATSWGQMIANGFAMLGLGWWLYTMPALVVVMVAGLVAAATLQTRRLA